MAKQNKLRGDWANLLPQESTKTKQPKIETSPWRCRYCKTDLVRFKLASSLRRHVSTIHPLLKNCDLTVFNGSGKFLEGWHLCRTLLYFVVWLQVVLLFFSLVAVKFKS